MPGSASSPTPTADLGKASAYAALVRRTPLVSAPALGPGMHLKLESLQRTGSFKLRGACLRLDAIPVAERERGVVVASAGNHGLGVALAGQTLGIPVEVFVPAACPPVKRQGIAAFGATVLEGGPLYDVAQAAAVRRAAAQGACFVSAFDDELIIEGNGGTLADEILSQLPEVARVVVPVGGGGLVAGLLAHLAPRGVEVIGVQPEANCAMYHSLARGHALVDYPEGRPTLAEGCEGGVAERTFAICRRYHLDIRRVSEVAIQEAMAFTYRHLGVVAEPSAAVALAGIRSGVVPHEPTRPTVVVVSGGNAEPAVLSEILRTFPS